MKTVAVFSRGRFFSYILVDLWAEEIAFPQPPPHIVFAPVVRLKHFCPGIPFSRAITR